MTEQTVIDALQEALNDGEAIEQKLRALIRDRRVDPTILGIALTRIENFREDMEIAIGDVRQS